MPTFPSRRRKFALASLCLLAWAALAGICLRAQTAEGSGGSVQISALDADISVMRNAIDPQIVLADGKLLAAAWVAGSDDVSRLTLLRFNPDGSIDPGFDVSALAPREVWMLKLLPDGKLLMTGRFGPNPNADLLDDDDSDDSDDGSDDSPDNSVGVIYRPDPLKLVRLNADGSLDASFTPLEYAFGQPDVLQPLADGKLLVSRMITDDNDGYYYELLRINADGSTDAGFKASLPLDTYLDDLQVQPDGRLLLSLNAYHEENGSRLIRLNVDGSADAGFQPATQPLGLIDNFALLSDGKVFIVLSSDSFDDKVSPYRFARFNADGTLDAGFAQGSSVDGVVESIYSQPDGKLLLAGYFTTINGFARQGVARLNADGSVDESFDPLKGIDGLFSASLVHWADGGFAIGYNLEGDRPAVVSRFDAAGALISSRSLEFGDPIAQLLARPDGGVYVDINISVLYPPVSGSVGDVVALNNDFPDGFAPPPAGGVSSVVKDGLPIISLKTIRSEAYSGSAAKCKFLLTRTGDLSKDLYVDYTVQGTAVGGQDYQTLKGRRIIKAGKAIARIKIKPIGDRYGKIVTGKATVKLTLTPGSGYGVAAPSSARVKILSAPAASNQ